MFKTLDIDMGLRQLEDESIWFLNYTRGMVTGGDFKGLIFKPTNPTPVYTSLNCIPPGLKCGVRSYRKINEDWYVAFDWHD